MLWVKSPVGWQTPNVNVDLAYTTFGGVRVVFGTDDVRSAREALDS